VCATLPRAEPAPLGESCTVLLASATAFVPCADGLWCDPTTAGAAEGVCRTPLPLGDPCDDGDDYCADGLCDTTVGMCRALTILDSVGATCDEAQGIVCDPLSNLRCIGGQCQGGGDGTLGSACFASDFQRGCNSGMYCEPDPAGAAPGTCASRLPAGSACDNSGQCESGSCTASECLGQYCDY
jgi:hypothetical protein